ncbi:MAG: cytochrome c biogenesis heme-transporting ATPase CcmA [Betaproteobacteria bacterium]
MPLPTPMLEAQDLAAERGQARLFRGVAFRIEPGCALAVTGSNGSGKTTLLRILAGLSAPAAGSVRLAGIPVKPFDPRLREAIAFGGHLPALKDELTALENLESLTALAGTRVTHAVLREALDRVALARPQALPARVLSQGQRRRIGLARLRVLRKPLWILDEPATALDREGNALFDSMLAEHLDDGGAAVVATHQPIDLPPARVSALAIDACAS